MDMQEIIQFLLLIGRLKKVKRSGWISHLGVSVPESVAEHTFRCAILGMCIGDILNLNTEKLVKMLLLHDIQESVTGDFDYYAKQKIGTAQIEASERKSIKYLLSFLPRPLKRHYLSLWREFTHKESTEAMVARDIDKLEMMLQALEYEKEGFSPDKLNVFWDDVQGRVKNPFIVKLLELIKSRRT